MMLSGRQVLPLSDSKIFNYHKRVLHASVNCMKEAGVSKKMVTTRVPSTPDSGLRYGLLVFKVASSRPRIGVFPNPTSQ